MKLAKDKVSLLVVLVEMVLGSGLAPGLELQQATLL